MQTKPLSDAELKENVDIIRFLHKKGMTAKQIRSLNYRQIDLKKKIIYFDKQIGHHFVERKIRYRGTPVENLFLREPVSRIFVLYKRYPFRNFYRKNVTILPPECMYHDYEIKKICGIEERELPDVSPLVSGSLELALR